MWIDAAAASEYRTCGELGMTTENPKKILAGRLLKKVQMQADAHTRSWLMAQGSWQEPRATMSYEL